MLGATPLNGHQHLCCHYIMDPKRRFDFDNWAAAEAPHLRGAHWIMLSTDNRLLLIAKMNPWTRPIFDILEEFYSVRDIDNMLNSGVIEISPLGFMRGRTFKRAFIIADEMQNSSPNQMLMLATRLGEKSRMVVTGDLKQSDRMESNGLLDLMRKIEAFKGERDLIQMVSMGQGDVQRSEVVSKILEIYEGNVQEKEEEDHEEKARRLKIVDGF